MTMNNPIVAMDTAMDTDMAMAQDMDIMKNNKIPYLIALSPILFLITLLTTNVFMYDNTMAGQNQLLNYSDQTRFSAIQNKDTFRVLNCSISRSSHLERGSSQPQRATTRKSLRFHRSNYSSNFQC